MPNKITQMHLIVSVSTEADAEVSDYVIETEKMLKMFNSKGYNLNGFSFSLSFREDKLFNVED